MQAITAKSDDGCGVASGTGTRNQRRLRNFLIDARFQVPWVLAAVALVAAVFGTLGAYIVWQENTASGVILEGLNQMYEPEEASLMAELFRTSDRTMLWSLVAAGGGLIVALALVGIVMTHKVAGPMFGLLKAVRRLADGDYREVRRFRKGDAFQEVSEAVVALSETLHAREIRDLDALNALRVFDLPPDAVLVLNGLLAEKRARLR